VTRERGPVPYRGASGRPAWPAADLGAIRRSEELIEMLAGRDVPARTLSDPVVALLSRLTADIDGAPGRAARPAGPRHRARRAWPHAAAAAAMAAAIATFTAMAAAGLMIVGWATAMRKPRSP
jgi:hypothetical protein